MKNKSRNTAPPMPPTLDELRETLDGIITVHYTSTLNVTPWESITQSWIRYERTPRRREYARKASSVNRAVRKMQRLLQASGYSADDALKLAKELVG